MEYNNNQPIYLQIADIFCDNILQKKWMEDDKIPSIRDIAVEMEVNPNTVLRTYNHLQDSGIIFNKRGLGYFVSPGGLQRTRMLKKEQFFNIDLPLFFKTLNSLEISVEEITNLYSIFKQDKNNS